MHSRAQAMFILSLAVLLLVAGPLARAEPLYSVSASALIDDAGNDSFDIEGLILPTAYLTLSAGVGQSHTDGRYGDLNGDVLRGAIDLHNEQLGVRVAYSQWKDSSDYESRTPRLTLYATFGEVQFALIGEQRKFDIGYTVLTASGPSDRTFSFDGTGFGGSLNWFGARWGAYVEAVGYDYGSDLERLVFVANSPYVERFPALQALVGSILVQAETALDYQAAAGVQRQFARATLAFDLYAIKGAIDGTEGRTASASLQVATTRILDLELTIGVNDTEGFDTAIFGGIGFTLHN